MSGRYYILRGSLRSGPFSEQEMLDLVQTGRLGADEWCQREGSAVRERVADLFDLLPAPRRPYHDADVESPVERVTDGEYSKGSEESGDGEYDEEDEEILDFVEDPSHEGEDEDEEDDEAEVSADRRRRSGYLFRAHPSFLRYRASLAGVVILLTAGYYLAAYHAAFVFGAVAVSSLVLAAIAYLRASREYLVSRRRVELVHGLIARSSREVRIEDIRAINVRKTGWLGLLGVGTVEFSSAGSEHIEVAFDDVRNPHGIRRVVRSLQDRGD